MYLQKVISNNAILLTSWRSLTKIAGSASVSGSIRQRYWSAGSGSVPKYHGTATLPLSAYKRAKPSLLFSSEHPERWTDEKGAQRHQRPGNGGWWCAQRLLHGQQWRPGQRPGEAQQCPEDAGTGQGGGGRQEGQGRNSGLLFYSWMILIL